MQTQLTPAFGIPLWRRDGSIGAYALVDATDRRFAECRWYLARCGYAQRHRPRANGTTHDGVLLLHREILGLAFGDGRQVDHINGDKLDNRRTNLRVVDQTANNQNVPKRPGLTSRYRNVSYMKSRDKWFVAIKVDGRSLYGGTYDDEDEAGRAAQKLRERYAPFAQEERCVVDR